MNTATEDQATQKPVEWSVWPPPLASRETRRACTKRRHDGMIKAGYCALCGTQVATSHAGSRVRGGDEDA